MESPNEEWVSWEGNRERRAERHCRGGERVVWRKGKMLGKNKRSGDSSTLCLDDLENIRSEGKGEKEEGKVAVRQVEEWKRSVAMYIHLGKWMPG